MKFYNVSFEKNNVYQANLVQAANEEQAKRIFEERKPDAKICGITEQADITEDLRKGKPIIK